MSTSEPFSRSDPIQAEHLEEPTSTSSGKMSTVSWRSRKLSLSHSPNRLPENIQSPKYAIGDRCRWIPINTMDWGTVIGQVIAPVEPVQSTTPQWVWLYLVLLDLDNPSRQWVVTDWAEEDDLESLHPPAWLCTVSRRLMMSKRTSDPHPFGSPERALFQIYVNCALALEHPRQLYNEYALTYEDLAYIAGCTTRTIERWMSHDEEPKLLKGVYLRRLGEFYFLLRHYQTIPPDVWNVVCPLTTRDRSILYPSLE